MLCDICSADLDGSVEHCSHCKRVVHQDHVITRKDGSRCCSDCIRRQLRIPTMANINHGEDDGRDF